MTYTEVINKYLSKVLQLYNSNPKRREPGDGSDGYCDCIGLIIGAIRRMGLKWNGIHGCNWAARKEVKNLKPIENQSELQPGDIVFKAVPKGHKNWNLPTRYRLGGKYYTIDQNDYYHAGVVYSVNPLQIRQMSAKMCTDTKVNTYYPWTHFAKLTILINASDKNTQVLVSDPSTPKDGSRAVVTALQGNTVNLRVGPGLKQRIMCRVPIGSEVSVISPGEEWCHIEWNNFKGYMMAEFLDIIGDGKGKY